MGRLNAPSGKAAAVCEGHQCGNRGRRQHVTNVVIVGDHARDRDEYRDYEEREPPLGKDERESKEGAPTMSDMSRRE
jgi:hypothetical protein